VLERVVVTGTVNGSAQRAMPVALDIVEGRELERRDARSLSSILDGSVPGIWIWEQSPTNLLARYASIRGASSFGISYPKVYIDGIEVANSLLVTELDVESVDHVEVIRGPQGAALYGADAISGVEYALPCKVLWVYRGSPTIVALAVDGIPTRAVFAGFMFLHSQAVRRRLGLPVLRQNVRARAAGSRVSGGEWPT